MRVKEVIKYLVDADPDLDVVVMDRKTYDRLLRKAKKFDEVLKHLRDAYKSAEK